LSLAEAPDLFYLAGQLSGGFSHRNWDCESAAVKLTFGALGS
jgi:hypothetical protein